MSTPKATLEDKKRQRLLILENSIRWFEEIAFTKKQKKFYKIPNACENINWLYWKYLESHVKPHLVSSPIGDPKAANIFKIASLTELSVMHVLPFRSDVEDHKLVRTLNGTFAYYLAKKFFDSYMNHLSIDINPQSDLAKDEASNFVKIHIRWLTHLETSQCFPVFSNAQTWRLFYCLLNNLEKSSLNV